MKKKIAYIGIKGFPSKAGVDRVVEAIVTRLDKRLFEPTVYCSNRVTPKDFHIDGVRLIRIPTINGKSMHALSLYQLSSLHALLIGGYDLIHIHNVETCFFLPLLGLRYKTISTSHGAIRDTGKWGKTTQSLMKFSERQFMTLSDCRTTVSLDNSIYYQKLYGKEVCYVPNGVDNAIRTDPVSSAKILKEYCVEPGKYILFAAGRIVPSKGCHVLLNAFRKLNADLPLLVVGDFSHVPEYTKELRQIANDRVKFIPFISVKETLFGLIDNAQLFVYPTFFEGMSMMLLEVASIGTPIICTEIPANMDCLQNYALFFKSEDPEDLHNKLSWALTHPENMKVLAENAKRRVYENYNWEPIVHQYESLYRELC